MFGNLSKETLGLICDLAIGIPPVLFGALVICAVFYDWSWYWAHPKAKFVVKIFGKRAAQTFYIIAGLFLILFGLDWIFSWNFVI